VGLSKRGLRGAPDRRIAHRSTPWLLLTKQKTGRLRVIAQPAFFVLGVPPMTATISVAIAVEPIIAAVTVAISSDSIAISGSMATEIAAAESAVIGAGRGFISLAFPVTFP